MKNDLGQMLAAGLYDKRGGPARNVIAAADHVVPGAIAFQGNLRTLESAGKRLEVSIDGDEKYQIAGILFKTKTEFVSRNVNQLKESGITVVNGGPG